MPGIFFFSLSRREMIHPGHPDGVRCNGTAIKGRTGMAPSSSPPSPACNSRREAGFSRSQAHMASEHFVNLLHPDTVLRWVGGANKRWQGKAVPAGAKRRPRGRATRSIFAAVRRSTQRRSCHTHAACQARNPAAQALRDLEFEDLFTCSCQESPPDPRLTLSCLTLSCSLNGKALPSCLPPLRFDC